MKTTRVFLDTEFSGLHQATTLISIGLIAETGQTFYAELTDYDQAQVDGWLKENIIDKLILDGSTNAAYLEEWILQGTAKDVREALVEWFKQFENVEIWSDCLAYDWVLFCQIFGHAFNIPKNICYIPFDICTLFVANGINPDISREKYAENSIYADCENTWDMTEDEANEWVKKQKHNALWDAKVIRWCFDQIMDNSKKQTIKK